MRTRIVPIGNSQGVRIPKALLEKSGITGEVSLTIQEGRIVITSIRQPREGWEEEFRKMAEAGDDQMLDDPTSTKFDEEEWVWE
ncbi:MAG: AbrB/MazE/SpoVT family DNA-binding domain-containing protein [Ignavibacteriae bacterium]|nr:AbrB/MazE/SpoVT family DNA-binding domain-containing protein [Ignavibacteriota bacterium]MCB9214942.1 AbrB/MazE/SpoVT family DNA-binding domain-containing protein [Ignavibacteria bacterium]